MTADIYLRMDNGFPTLLTINGEEFTFPEFQSGQIPPVDGEYTKPDLYWMLDKYTGQWMRIEKYTNGHLIEDEFYYINDINRFTKTRPKINEKVIPYWDYL